MAETTSASPTANLDNIWSTLGAWPEFIQTMRLALSPGGKPAGGGASEDLMALPVLCCRAAGGQAAWAAHLSLAWGLYYIAAHLMDSIQDNDQVDAWWQDWKPGVGLNAASGLFFTAASSLNRMIEQPIPRETVQSVFDDFYSGFLVMCAGQFLDLTHTEPTLDQYWATLAAKSGAFFALACRCGARLATQDTEVIAAFSEFGQNLGAIIQIRDDLDDIRPGNGTTAYGQRPQLLHSLPYIYALNVLVPADRDRLRKSAKLAYRSKREAQKAIQLIDRAGASLYVRVMLKKHTDLSHQALDRLTDSNSNLQILHDLVDRLS